MSITIPLSASPLMPRGFPRGVPLWMGTSVRSGSRGGSWCLFSTVTSCQAVFRMAASEEEASWRACSGTHPGSLTKVKTPSHLNVHKRGRERVRASREQVHVNTQERCRTSWGRGPFHKQWMAEPQTTNQTPLTGDISDQDTAAEPDAGSWASSCGHLDQ